jgi:hypothetical protein
MRIQTNLFEPLRWSSHSRCPNGSAPEHSPTGPGASRHCHAVEVLGRHACGRAYRVSWFLRSGLWFAAGGAHRIPGNVEFARNPRRIGGTIRDSQQRIAAVHADFES